MRARRALVTGAGTGIGRGIALELGERGADVVLHYVNQHEGVDEAQERLTQLGRRVAAIQADFRQVEDVERLARESIEFLGGVDILVNNAGVTQNIPIQEITSLHFDTLFHINVRAQMLLTKALVPEMEKHTGSAIINISSVHAYAGMTGHAVYAATKGAIVAYTREVALELIPLGIRVNAIAPGWVRVPNQETALGSGFDWDKETAAIPVGFAAEPRDIGKLVVFLCSEDARFIVGQTIIADGGQLAIMPLTGDFREPRAVRFGTLYT